LRSHISAEARFAQEFSCHFVIFPHLYEVAHVSETRARKAAQNEAPRVGLGTVLRTVPGAIQIASWTGSPSANSRPTADSKARGTARAVVSPNLAPTSRPVRKVIWIPTCAATRSATSSAIPKPVPNPVRGTIRRPTFAAPLRRLRRRVSGGLRPQEPNPIFTLHYSLFTVSSPLALPGRAPIMNQAPRVDVRYHENGETQAPLSLFAILNSLFPQREVA
jgi:hypothetical protein